MNLREWPLVLFTVIGQAAAGAAVVLLLPLTLGWAGAAGPAGREYRLGAALLVFFLASLAAFFSFFHLGRPFRAPNALRNIAGSWLSRELVCLLLFIASAALLAFAEGKGLEAAPILGPITAAAGLAFVLAMAKIYMFPAVPDWNSWRTPAAFFFTAFVLGAMTAAVYAAKGIFFLRFSDDGILEARFRIAALIILDAAYMMNLFFSPRFGRLVRKATPLGFRPDPAWPAVFTVRMILLTAAIFSWALALLNPGMAGLLSGMALTAAAASEIIGRFLFYALPLGL